MTTQHAEYFWLKGRRRASLSRITNLDISSSHDNRQHRLGCCTETRDTVCQLKSL